jgi:hypothetical protein
MKGAQDRRLSVLDAIKLLRHPLGLLSLVALIGIAVVEIASEHVRHFFATYPVSVGSSYRAHHVRFYAEHRKSIRSTTGFAAVGGYPRNHPQGADVAEASCARVTNRFRGNVHLLAASAGPSGARSRERDQMSRICAWRAWPGGRAGPDAWPGSPRC